MPPPPSSRPKRPPTAPACELSSKTRPPARSEASRSARTKLSWRSSHPPYYTACPNPFLDEIIQKWQEERDLLNQQSSIGNPKYHREPFAADVSEGKNDPIYNAHSYHTKVPHKAIMRYLLHYTDPGDIVFDGFCGTGMTGVAAQLCGDRKTVDKPGVSCGQRRPGDRRKRGNHNKLGFKKSYFGGPFASSYIPRL